MIEHGFSFAATDIDGNSDKMDNFSFFFLIKSGQLEKNEINVDAFAEFECVAEIVVCDTCDFCSCENNN